MIDNSVFREKRNGLLSVYFPAGYPELNSLPDIVMALDGEADIIEVGIPFSDPVADGTVIQAANTRALANDITLNTIFAQLRDVMDRIATPVFLMGYLNPILQYGVEPFCQQVASLGVSGVIIPDLPLDYYEQNLKSIFTSNGVNVVFMVAPNTPNERIRRIDSVSCPFIYAMSSFAVTGGNALLTATHASYLERLRGLELRNPVLVGFGIGAPATLAFANSNANGAIVGTAFVNQLCNVATSTEAVRALRVQLGLDINHKN